MARWQIQLATALVALTVLPSCAASGGGYAPSGMGSGGPHSSSSGAVGTASFYHRSFEGRRTASGEPYDRRRLTAAHRTLPFGSRVRVTNLENGLSVVVLVNDRGPFRKGRVIDVSEEAARELGFYRAGTARVRVEELASRE
jgi:rare lipoprotein A